MKITMKKLLMTLATAALSICSCANAAPSQERLPPEQLAPAKDAQYDNTDNLLRLYPATPIDDLWKAFKLEYDRNYGNEEDYRRKQIFMSNVQTIKQHNVLHSKGLKSFRLGITNFADMSAAEYLQRMNSFVPHSDDVSEDDATDICGNLTDIPEAIDWNEKGYVTDVRDQKACHASWAFSATGAIEGQFFKKKRELVELSQQNLIDCDDTNHGCNGGSVKLAFLFVIKQQGIEKYRFYPYETQRGSSCRYNGGCSGGKINGFETIRKGCEIHLRKAVADNGPVSVAVDARHYSFQHYSSGVYYETGCSSDAKDLKLSVLVVGYGNEDGNDYWLVKNSFGTSWGEDGYIKMSRDRDNNCGIATAAIYPTVEKA